MKKISICTVCMNRYTYLRETLPVNIKENLNYPNVEFVLLNYNSKDGLDSWVRDNMAAYIESGILKYYVNDKPEFFDLSHSKNMALKLATGDILCMVDADNYAGPGYAAWVNSVFELNGDNTLITTLRKKSIPYRDQGGKLCFHRDLFYKVKGFDESLIGYGIDDVDLINRMEKAGGIRYFIEDEEYLKFIGHTMVERLENHHLINNLENIYLKYPETNSSQANVVYLLKDNTYFDITYELQAGHNKEWVTTFGGWTMQPESRRTGTFSRNNQKLSLSLQGDFVEKVPGIATAAHNSSQSFLKEVHKSEDLYYGLIMGYGECMNRLIYLKNDQRNPEDVNITGWGAGDVYRNFNVADTLSI